MTKIKLCALLLTLSFSSPSLVKPSTSHTVRETAHKKRKARKAQKSKSLSFFTTGAVLNCTPFILFSVLAPDKSQPFNAYKLLLTKPGSAYLNYAALASHTVGLALMCVGIYMAKNKRVQPKPKKREIGAPESYEACAALDDKQSEQLITLSQVEPAKQEQTGSGQEDTAHDKETHE